MIKPNWDLFKAKFNENPQHNFEWFCYLLFCRKFDRLYGIFRYKNQTAIENDPIEVSDEVIGWQAKFYSNTLSNHKEELLTTIIKAKDKYPKISIVYMFSNQEWGQYQGDKPKGQIEIEDKAKELGITIKWRLSSFFESEFVTLECKEISKHFFSNDKSIVDAIEEQQERSKNILYEINTEIPFKGKKIHIKREGILEKLISNKNQVSILSGVGGVGKTAEIKLLFEELNVGTPFIVFKAKEFELRSINELLKDYSYHDFLSELKKADTKYIIIDSAEKLLELNNSDPFKEFLSALLQDNWKIIFTTRENYLENLNYQFLEIFNIVPSNINIGKVDEEVLKMLSKEYDFILPVDDKLFELISIPFYLKEYLTHYEANQDINYTEFKNQLWNKTVKKTTPERERCFIKIAIEKANSGLFYVQPECDYKILDNELVKDGLLGYEVAGYFITHDIYEEWALEKFIEISFITRSSVSNFFETIGSSLPIRRCFRSWLSDKIFEDISDVQDLIDEIITTHDIERYWKDETIVSLLLSKHSTNFFSKFKDKILHNNCELFRDIVFLLRIACKEIDQDILGTLGLPKGEALTLQFLMTKPTGNGWKSAITFAYDNLHEIETKNIGFIIPLLFDWNFKFKNGTTTKFSSLISLNYYKWLVEEGVYISNSDTKNNIIQTITCGALEIKSEIEGIIDDALKYKWKKRNDPYYDLLHPILTEIHGLNVAKVLPEKTLLLADLYWTYIKEDEGYYSSRDMYELEHAFCIEKDFYAYYPSSSMQTPIYFLLQDNLLSTVNFLIDFTNKKVEYFSNSEYGKNEVEKVNVYIDDTIHSEQYISNRLWCMYRGTQDSPNVLESIHMALERFFLEQGKHANSATLEKWLFYLLTKSISSSISAIVASIVLAYPEKTFNVAACLFRTKLFFYYDLNRQQLDLTYKTQLQSLSSMFGQNYLNQIHENERIKACDDKHRKIRLEDLCLKYQVFREEGTSEEEVNKRQSIIWEIFDKYYEELGESSFDDEYTKTWKLCLARMDRRKMSITTEQTETGTAIYFNPEIEPKLQRHSDEAQESYKEKTKYLSLLLWARYRFRREGEYKDYPQYEDNIPLVFSEITEILTEIERIKLTVPKQELSIHRNDYLLYNHSIPAIGYSLLIRDFKDSLSQEQLITCKNQILKIILATLDTSYKYQISDGVQECFTVLPIIYKSFQEDRIIIKKCLLLTVFNERHIGGIVSDIRFNDFSLFVIKNLWSNFPTDAKSIVFGCLLLQSKYKAVEKKLYEQHSDDMFYHVERKEVWLDFIKHEQETFDLIESNTINSEHVFPLSDHNHYSLLTVLKIIGEPQKDHKINEIAKSIIYNFSQVIFHKIREDKLNFHLRDQYLKIFAHYVLNLPISEIPNVLQSTLDNLKSSEAIAEMFTKLVSTQDYLQSYESFWFIWNYFKESVIELGKQGDDYLHIEGIIKSYLFATVPWKQGADSWHSIQKENEPFFDDICLRLGHCPSVLYSISKLLNDIGSMYQLKGVEWLAVIIGNLPKDKEILDSNSIYFVENFVRKFVFEEKEKIKKNKELKSKVIKILNLLIKNGSVAGYMLRESIL